MKIKFLSPMKHETTSSKGVIFEEFFSRGLVVEVKTVEVNEEFQTATIEFTDGSRGYGFPMNVFEVIEL